MRPSWDEWGSDDELTVQIPPRRADRFYVYVAWGKSKRPLYVGKARNPWVRFGNHMGSKEWAGEVRRLECHGFPTEKAALDAEIEAILALDPIHNVMRREPERVIRERSEWWREFQAEKREKLQRRREEDVVRKAAWHAKEAERVAAKALAPPPPQPRVVRSEREPLSPRQHRRVRVVRWNEDIFTPEQMAIIARVQNRGRAA